MEMSYTLNIPPPVAGYLRITPEFKVAASARPSWLHRHAIRWVFGWVWEDA